jgi:hypothetical protein
VTIRNTDDPSGDFAKVTLSCGPAWLNFLAPDHGLNSLDATFKMSRLEALRLEMFVLSFLIKVS